MVRIIVLTLFVVAFMASPVWLFDRFVMPELAGFKDIYDNAETLTGQAERPTGSTWDAIKPRQ